MRLSKQVLKSVLSIGDGWVWRAANNPCAELQGKVDNMRCNLKKNHKMRRATREALEREEREYEEIR